MTVTTSDNNSSYGIHMSSAKVKLIDVAIKGRGFAALHISTSTSETTVVATRCEFANNNHGALVYGSVTSATFNNCVFNDNEYDGIYGYLSTVHLHGEATAIHSNGNFGISAYESSKVIIHLPSHHNTIYNNGKEDRFAIMGGTITNVED